MKTTFTCHLLGAVLGSFLIGCATKPPPPDQDPLSGVVAARIVEEKTTDSYPVASGISYDAPKPAPDNPLPVYPTDLLVQRLPPVHTRIRLIVNELGWVTRTIAVEGTEKSDPRFQAAVDAEVRTWRFIPLVRVVEAPGTTELTFDDVIITYEGIATALPFRQDYEFTFTQHDGKGMVSSSQQPDESK